MTLSPRDAIQIDELDRYDTFMAALGDTQFLDMYLTEANVVQIDVYEISATESPAHSATFVPSEYASQYFDQEAQRAAEILETPTDADLGKRINTCERKQPEATAAPDIPLGEGVSRCNQFCGTIAHCRGNGRCPHCYAVRQGCLWQKACR